jgi:hypothetical protein
MVRKPLISTVLRLLSDFLSLKNYVNVPSKSEAQNKKIKNKISKATDEKGRIGSGSQR